MRIVRDNGMLVIKPQCLDETYAKLVKEMQRTAEERYMAANRLAAGKT